MLGGWLFGLALPGGDGGGADELRIAPASEPISGCRFHPRCRYAMERCRAEVPALKPIADGRLSACHLNDQA